MPERQPVSLWRRPTAVGTGRASGALLFVRSVSDLSAAVRSCNHFISRRTINDALGGDVLGLFVGSSIDTPLEEPGIGVDRDVGARVTLRESVALSGIWSLCWFDVGSVDDSRHAGDRRRRLLDDLCPGTRADRRGAGRQRYFLPVFTSVEAAEQDLDLLLGDLAARYPAWVIGKDCFVVDAACGGLVQLGADDLPLRRQRSS